MWNDFLASPSEASLGVYLHALQDSYAHRGFGAFFGHIFRGHGPDKTYKNIDKAMEMAEATYNTLVDAAKAMGVKGKAVAFDAIKDKIKAYLNINEKDDKDGSKRDAAFKDLIATIVTSAGGTAEDAEKVYQRVMQAIRDFGTDRDSNVQSIRQSSLLNSESIQEEEEMLYVYRNRLQQ